MSVLKSLPLETLKAARAELDQVHGSYLETVFRGIWVLFKGELDDAIGSEQPAAEGEKPIDPTTLGQTSRATGMASVRKN